MVRTDMPAKARKNTPACRCRWGLHPQTPQGLTASLVPLSFECVTRRLENSRAPNPRCACLTPDSKARRLRPSASVHNERESAPKPAPSPSCSPSPPHPAQQTRRDARLLWSCSAGTPCTALLSGIASTSAAPVGRAPDSMPAVPVQQCPLTVRVAVVVRKDMPASGRTFLQRPADVFPMYFT